MRVAVPGATLERIGEAAAEASAYVVLGVTEIDGGTLYNTLLYLGPDGRLVQAHRKLMPTGGERTVWGMGDGSELGVVTTPFGVVGGLLCWENYMPLARAAIYAQHCDIYLAPTWDNSDTWVATLRHIAKEGRQFVIGVAPLLRGSDVPEDLRGTLYGLEDDWMSRGHTTIVAPGGEVIAGPVLEREEIVYADLDLAAVQEQRRMLDPVGHYARPDVFTLHVDTRAKRPVVFDGETPT
jgi:nitrilase